jgi:Na+-driven multidrug efflux pump
MLRLPILHLHRDAWHWDNAFAIEHLRIGIPMACQFSILGIGILLIQSVCNHFGPNHYCRLYGSYTGRAVGTAAHD